MGNEDKRIPAPPPQTPTPADVNYGDQLNPDHEAYWKSRGLPMPANPADRRPK